MAFNFDFIRQNSAMVYDLLHHSTRCTFNELQKGCNLSNTDLCLALANLMRDNRISQNREEEEIYYECNH